MEKSLTLQDVYVSTPLLRADAALRTVCRIFAAIGGIILACLTLLTVTNVIGRALFNTPISGNFELVELGCAISVSAFLPYCQIQEGNVIVDIVTAKAPQWLIRFLGAVGDLLFMAISILICWRLFYGCLDSRESMEVTMVLGIPVWWAMPPMIVSFALLTLTCGMTMLNRIFAPGASETPK